MLGKFIYVFNEDSRDKLIACNYKLVNANAKSGTYVFENKMEMSFDLSGVKLVYSDVLTF